MLDVNRGVLQTQDKGYELKALEEAGRMVDVCEVLFNIILYILARPNVYYANQF